MSNTLYGVRLDRLQITLDPVRVKASATIDGTPESRMEANALVVDIGMAVAKALNPSEDAILRG